MRAVTAWNGGAFVAALALSTSVAWTPRRALPATESRADELTTPLIDHAGATVPRARYTRIASVSALADQLLLELCEPDRILAFTAYSAERGTNAHRFKGKPTIAEMRNIEAVLALRPDLVLVSSVGDPRPVARLREAGLAVFDLGDMRGLATLVPNIRDVAALVGAKERGERLVQSLTVAMNAVAIDVPPAQRKRGLYVSGYGGHFFGGGSGTSYHDVIASAGLVDAAASYRDWPDYAPEQLIAMDPDVIVTNDGMRARLCEHTGLQGLRACASPAGIVELDMELLGDPGLVMLEAAQLVRRAVYGAPTSH